MPPSLPAGTELYGCQICNYKVALVESLDDYQPENDRSHQWLGISYEGMVRFLEIIGFICWAAEDENEEDKYRFHECLSWSYPPSYQRPGKLASWLDPIVGPVQKDDSTRNSTGLKNVAGYDLCEFLRAWLKRESLPELSVCEVILTQEPYRHLRTHVRRANLFWSHIQLEGLLGRQSTLSGIAYQNHGE
jgi:hypothetical protein